MTTTPDDSVFPLSLDLGENGAFSFASVNEIADWIRKEQAWWRGFNQNKRGPNPDAAIQAADQRWQKISVFATKTLNQENATGSAKDGFVSFLRERIRTPGLFTSTSPRGEFISQLREQDTDVAAAAALHFLRTVPIASDAATLPGAIDAALFEKSLSPATAENFMKATQEVAAQLSTVLGNARESAKTFESEAQGASARLADAEKLWNGLLSGAETRLSTFVEAKEESLKKEAESIEGTYREKMALKSTVEYWKKRREDTGSLAKSYRNSFYVGLGVAFVALIAFAPGTVSGADAVARALRFVLVSLPVFWLLKTLSKLHLTNLHLEVDAAERETIATSYLALLTEKDAISPEHREIALRALFRRSQASILPDDTAPVTLGTIALDKFGK